MFENHSSGHPEIASKRKNKQTKEHNTAEEKNRKVVWQYAILTLKSPIKSFLNLKLFMNYSEL